MTDQMAYSTGFRSGEFGGHMSGAMVCHSAMCV